MQGTYRFYPNLVREAAAAGHIDSGFKYWMAMSAFAGKYVAMPSVKECLMQLFDIKVRNVYKVVSGFNKTLWDYYPGTDRAHIGELRIYTPEEIAKAYGLKKPGPFVERPLTELLGSCVRAYMYKGMLEDIQTASCPISRKKLAELTGIKVRSQQYYHSALEMPRRANFEVVAALPTLGDCRQRFLDLDLKAGPHKISKLHVSRDTKTEGTVQLIMWAICKRLPNTYYENYSESGGLKYLGKAAGSGVWIEKKLCTKLQRYPQYSISITEFPETPSAGVSSRLELAPVYYSLYDEASRGAAPSHVSSGESAWGLESLGVSSGPAELSGRHGTLVVQCT